MKEIHVFWTGGFDSSYRIVQLSKYDIVIQPYYLIDNNRISKENEFGAIADIMGDIEKHPETKCKIRPLIKLNSKDINPDENVTAAYQRLQKNTQLGSQYDWLARFAKEQNIEFELCLESEPGSKALQCIEKYGAVKDVSEGEISYCVIDREKSSEDLITIFGRFHFPLPLFRISKLETLEEYKKLGFESTVSKTWFCHAPQNGVPCGLCNPCKSVIEAGMTFRLPPEALKRYYTIRKKPIMWKWYRIKRHVLGFFR